MHRFILCSLWLSAILLPVGAAVDARARDTIDFSAVKRTGDQSKGDKQDLGRGSSRVSTKAIYYEITCTARTTDLPSTAMAEWMMLVKSPGGNLRVAAKGSQKVELVFGRRQTLLTDSVDLAAMEIDTPGHRADRKFEEKLAGAAVRLLGENEQVLAEASFPGSLSKDIEWAPEKKAQPDIRRDALTPWGLRRRPPDR